MELTKRSGDKTRSIGWSSRADKLDEHEKRVEDVRRSLLHVLFLELRLGPRLRFGHLVGGDVLDGEE